MTDRRLAVPLGRAPVLVLGLGNTLMGDEGIGVRLAEALADDPRLAGRVEVATAGTDLLAAAELFRGRRRVLLVDAIEPEGPQSAAEAVVLDPRAGVLDESSGGAHSLSVAACLRLLLGVDPELARVDFRLFAVPIDRAEAGAGLSAGLEARLPELVGRLRAESLEGLGGEAARSRPERHRMAPRDSP